MTDRRTLLKTLALGGITLPMVNDGLLKSQDIPTGLRILFQGDSITDAGRNRGRYYPNDSAGIGGGYVRQIATELLGLNPGKAFQVYNRGISGHKVFQLANRWNDDCLQLQPDVLSILIGVNDYWHTLSNNYNGTAAVYERDLKKLLDETLGHLPDVRIMIGEPFVLLDGTAIDKGRWENEFPAYREASQSIAREYSAGFVPYQSVFDKALNLADTAYWCPDGVHPSMAGNYLMATTWLETFYKLFD